MDKDMTELAKRLIEITEDTESALAEAACESRAVGKLTAPDSDTIVEAMSALEDVDPLVDEILGRLARARRGLGAP